LVGRLAVLISDGHISRFTVGTVNLIMEHNIDCVILPSHSSHLIQPLDQGPNGIIIKRVFRRTLTETSDVTEEEKEAQTSEDAQASMEVEGSVVTERAVDTGKRVDNTETGRIPVKETEQNMKERKNWVKEGKETQKSMRQKNRMLEQNKDRSDEEEYISLLKLTVKQNQLKNVEKVPNYIKSVADLRLRTGMCD